MLGVSGMLGNSGDGAAAHESGGGGGGGGGGGEVGVSGLSSGGFSEDEKMRIEEGDRSSGGNRWPRQETIALLKIRSDMDVVFRDSSLKGPLWEEVSRKLAELGYHRSAKKCKEKFENVYKYHKRTKDGRGTKADGKSYRFFDQLEALEQIHQSPVSYAPPLPPPPQPPHQTQQQQPVVSANPVAVAMPVSISQVVPPHVTVSSTTTNQIISFSQNPIAPIALQPRNPFPSSNTILPPPPPTTTSTPTAANPYPYPSFGSMSTSSSSTSSDQETEPRWKRKRKWEEFFQKVMKNVVEKQEEMQKKFLEKLERRERERVAREEAWRVQEMARLNKEHEQMVQERSLAAAKDAAVIAFLQKVSDQHQQVPNINQILLQPQPQAHPQSQPQPSQIQSTPLNPNPVQKQPQSTPQPQPTQQPPAQPQSTPQPVQQPPAESQQLALVQPQTTMPLPVANNPKSDNGGENYTGVSPSRWPKAEVQALIQLRTNMDIKYQENGPKGPLWEEISAEMKKIGYNRNAKRCKEKWENINKYFKKVKESNKKRPEDSKTCPYFHQLQALYKEKGKNESPLGFGMKPEVPIMVQPEQQWPIRPQQQQHHQPDSTMEERDSNENDEDDMDDGDDEDEASAYEVVVTNKPSSVAT